uniref:Prolactin releasing hormone n=1 Tax=Sinocyclocheilus rhinocerous TaxID=307959 RepID=A0A673KBI8_9TELE
MLLACFTQPKPHDDLPLCSMEIRDPNIDAVWYKGEGSYFGKHRFCYPEVLTVD